MEPKADEVFVIATAASTVSNYKVQLLFDGETVSSGKYYKCINTTALGNGSRVLCARVSGTWVVLGVIRA